MPKNDAEIIKRVLSGEKKAYSELVERHKDRAMTLALRMLRSREEAEEAVQDAFVRAFNALGGFQWRSSFATWFYRIVFNVCSTALSRRGTDVTISINDDEKDMGMELTESEGGPDLDLESAELQQAVIEEINSLPPTYSGVVTLFFLQELSYDEIVQVTGMPLGTVKAKLFRARLMLQRALQSRFHEERGVIPRKVAPAFR